jgi:ferredoxin
VRHLVEPLAGLGAQQAARMAVEQRDAQLILQRLDLTADRRLRKAEPIRCAGQAACLTCRVEGLQLTPVE